MKHTTLFALALAVLFSAGLYLHTFSAAGADVPRSGDVLAGAKGLFLETKDNGAKTDADQEKAAAQKDTLTPADFYAALEKAKSQYANGDNLCLRLAVIPNSDIIDQKYDAVTRSDYNKYLKDIQSLTLFNLQAEFSGDLFASYEETLPELFRMRRNTMIDDGGVYVLAKIGENGRRSASEMLSDVYLGGGSFENDEYFFFSGWNFVYFHTNSGEFGQIYPTAEQTKIYESLKK